ncbi:NAD(P)/FAD-dependent oxidoreductase [Pseudohalocynthiibacter aestuariivivens]|uniref:NAD(P)/FAD-dependent oxidoreductase n=1 Tax=Pseudohalocynthiibacter aestuariivivens TaxID=1591409 RepID=A0ABV5JHC4_9RHOB|nr:FAD-binding oxidoreductase [Pseudohalocynthiibacter aestuariivivens]MBS9715423.1 FAD-binding oxidoreductase [Pseudohalocynthiibacter aestuariivivens]
MADITVVGAGIFGLSIAWVCASRGAKVRVIEKHAIGAGSSGGIVGALAPHTPDNWNHKKEFQFQSLIMMPGFWKAVDDASNLLSGYAQLGRLQSLDDMRVLNLAQERISSAKDLWRGKAIWRVEEVGDRGDWAPKSKTGMLAFDTLSARINPRAATHSLAAAVQSLGVEILIGEAQPKGRVIWATGYHGLLDLSRALGQEVGKGLKGQAILLRHDAGDQPHLFADGIHIVPHENGTVAVGSTSEREFEDETSTDEQLDDLLERALNAFPVLTRAKVIERWAGVRPRAKTRAPMLGAYPGRADEYIANGGFKIGLGMAPKIAEVMADLVLEGRDEIPDPFRVEANL